MSFVRKNPSAGGIVYDNTASGLTATTLQEAVDELSSGGTELIKAISHQRNSTGFLIKLFCPELGVYLNAGPELIFTKSGQIIRKL